jgi:hypothetical protein
MKFRYPAPVQIRAGHFPAETCAPSLTASAFNRKTSSSSGRPDEFEQKMAQNVAQRIFDQGKK